MSEMPDHVDIRDGLQIEEPIPLSAKLDLLDAVAHDCDVTVEVIIATAWDAARVAQNAVGHQLPSALLRALNRMLG